MEQSFQFGNTLCSFPQMSTTAQYLVQYKNVLRKFHIPVRAAAGTSDYFNFFGKGNAANRKEFGPQTAKLAHSIPR